MHLQVKILNLDIFTSVPPSDKTLLQVLIITPGLIQIVMTAIKHKQSQVVYSYQLTTKQLFMCKVMVIL